MMRIKKKKLIFENRVKYSMPIPKEVKKLYKIFVENGFELYIVGGAVRDVLMNKPIKDYDLATDASPDTIESMLEKEKVRTIGTGKNFGVINAYINDEEFEIATFREDSKEGDGRRPDSVTFSTIDNDVKRRDLTINALFYDIKTKEIVDLVGGIADIKNKVIRTVGEPIERFEEDRLRILRAIRFAARVGSNLDKDIDKALKLNNSLDKVSPERVRDEFIKGIGSARSPKHYLGLLERYDLFKWVLKGIEPLNKSFVDSKDYLISMATILKDGDTVRLRKQLNGLKYSADESKQIAFLVALYQTEINEGAFYWLKKLHEASRVNNDTVLDFAQIMNMNIDLIRKFINFKTGSVKGEVVKQETGLGNVPELGEEIRKRETELFFNSI